ncbi:MAG: copper amine oxidase N-terminal domain-containing protein [Candidatus Baltobacteraceae bacterium]
MKVWVTRKAIVATIAFALASFWGAPCAAAPAAASTPAAQETPTRTISILINGQALPDDVQPRIVDGHVLLPLRRVFDALGIPVSRRANTIVGTLPNGTLVLVLGAATADVAGRTVQLDSPAADFEGTTYIPLRFVADAFGATTSYDGRGAKVEIVSPLIGRNIGQQQSAAGGRTIVKGTVSALDANSAPPSVTVTFGGNERTIAINSDARIYIEDVTINTQLAATLSDLRVGDALRVLLAKNGKVLEIHDFFRSTNGNVAAVSASAIVIAGGSVVTPASATEITLNGAVAKLGDLKVGDYVTVRRNPETSELRQIIASRKAAVNPTTAPASAAAIASLNISATRPLRAGESFDVTLNGTSGGQATFDIGNAISDVPMREASPGVYRASYTIPDRFNVTQIPIYGHLRVGDSVAPRAEASAQLSAATTPPAIVDVAPPSGQTVNATRPNIYATFESPSGIGINLSSIVLVVNGRNVTASATRSPTFITYSPGVDYPDGPVTVRVRVTDLAGNSASRSWTFTIRTQ